MRRLHIGGNIKADGWEIFNIVQTPATDHVGNAKDLSRFADRTFGEIYASHVLEHFSGREVKDVLREWHRVLDSEGKLYLSVPDNRKLSAMFADTENFSAQERINITQIMYGGHIDEHDVHHMGFDRDILLALLKEAGFASCQFVDELDIFTDCSTIRIRDELISLNVIVKKEKLEERKNPAIKASNIARDVFYVMSMPRLGFTDNSFSLTNSVNTLGLKGQRFQGVFWEQGLELLLESAIEKGYKYGLTIDFDTFYTPYHIQDLYDILESRPDIDILIPLQPRRGNKYPLSGTFEDDSGDFVKVTNTPFVNRVQPTDTAHFGLTIIRLESMKKLDKPWFIAKPDKKGGWGKGHKDADCNFWIRCKKAGIKAYLAEVWIGHLQLLCAFCGPYEKAYATSYMDINDILEGALPPWTVPKSYNKNEPVTNYLGEKK